MGAQVACLLSEVLRKQVIEKNAPILTDHLTNIDTWIIHATKKIRLGSHLSTNPTVSIHHFNHQSKLRAECLKRTSPRFLRFQWQQKKMQICDRTCLSSYDKITYNFSWTQNRRRWGAKCQTKKMAPTPTAILVDRNSPSKVILSNLREYKWSNQIDFEIVTKTLKFITFTHKIFTLGKVQKIE